MSQINSNTKDDFQVVFLLSCFVGHPVHKNAAYFPIFFATPLFMPNILRSEQILKIFRRWFDDKIDKI